MVLLHRHVWEVKNCSKCFLGPRVYQKPMSTMSRRLPAAARVENTQRAWFAPTLRQSLATKKACDGHACLQTQVLRRGEHALAIAALAFHGRAFSLGSYLVISRMRRASCIATGLRDALQARKWRRRPTLPSELCTAAPMGENDLLSQEFCETMALDVMSQTSLDFTRSHYEFGSVHQRTPAYTTCARDRVHHVRGVRQSTGVHQRTPAYTTWLLYAQKIHFFTKTVFECNLPVPLHLRTFSGVWEVVTKFRAA